MELWISVNTPVAPITSTIPPNTAPATVCLDRRVYLMISCICDAAALPTNPLICSYTRPCTASCPQKIPTREITSMTSGPIAKTIEYDKDAASLNPLSLLKSTAPFFIAVQIDPILNFFFMH